MTATRPGIVLVVARAMDESGVSDSMQILISTEKVMVSSVKAYNEDGISELPVGEQLQFSVDILPVDATNKEVVWMVNDITGDADISQDGLPT